MPVHTSLACILRWAAVCLLWLAGCDVWADTTELTIAMVDRSMVVELAARDVLAEAYRRLGVTVHFRQVPAARALAEASEGLVDGDLQRIEGLSATYPQLLQVGVPVNWVDMVVVTRDAHFTPDGWDSLRPYRIGFQRGIVACEVGTRGMRTDPATTNDLVLLKLAAGRTDIALMSQLEAVELLLRWRGVPLTILSPPVLHMRLYHYLNRKHADLARRLEAVLVDMTHDGSLMEIRQHALSALPAHLPQKQSSEPTH